METSTPNDVLTIQGVNSQGYGTIALSVMSDTRLAIESKAIYAYLCSYTGRGSTCYPSVDKICEDLSISKKRYYKFFTPLKDFGYISTYQGMREGSVFRHNVYVVNQVIKAEADESSENADCGKPEKHQVNGGGQIDYSQISEDRPDCGKLGVVENLAAKPLMSGGGQIGHSQIVYTINKPFGLKELKELKELKPHKGLKGLLDEELPALDALEVASNDEPETPTPMESPTDSLSAHLSTDQSRKGRTLTETEYADLAKLCGIAVNDNGNAYARRPYAVMLDDGYTAAEIESAWKSRQNDCNARACPPEYYPNLAEFLRSEGTRGAQRSIDRTRRKAEIKAKAMTNRDVEKKLRHADEQHDARLRRENPDYAKAAANVDSCKRELMNALSCKPGVMSVKKATEKFKRALHEKEQIASTIYREPTHTPSGACETNRR